MDITMLCLSVMALTMLVVTLQAWWLGLERRDVALAGAVGGLCGSGALAAALL
jgi:uncharacterized membrane protein YadS